MVILCNLSLRDIREKSVIYYKRRKKLRLRWKKKLFSIDDKAPERSYTIPCVLNGFSGVCSMRILHFVNENIFVLLKEISTGIFLVKPDFY